MIYRFKQVIPKVLYRGSAPSPQDVVSLKKDFNINKIVSLDLLAAERINKTCKLLDIQHVIIPIDIMNLKKHLLNFLSHDLKELFLENGPTFLHCEAGKDRTGLASALVQCKYLGKKPEQAIKEAKQLGFGIGIDPKIIHLFEHIIKSCKPEQDNNAADIVSNEREYIGDNRDSFLDEGHQGSFSPYLSITRQWPYDYLYNEINEQSPTRENYNQNLTISENVDLPLVGQYNNSAGPSAAGPLIDSGGFISE